MTNESSAKELYTERTIQLYYTLNILKSNTVVETWRENVCTCKDC